jgi:hypothetical protein
MAFMAAGASGELVLKPSQQQPLDFLIAVLNNENNELPMRIDAAKALLPYTNFRKGIVDTTGRNVPLTVNVIRFSDMAGEIDPLDRLADKTIEHDPSPTSHWADAVTGRDQLELLRCDLAARLSQEPLEGGDLALAAGVAAALALVESEAPPTDPGSCAVLADDGQKLVLTIYGSDGPLATTELSALHALTLAAELVTAARRRVGEIEAWWEAKPMHVIRRIDEIVVL